MHPEIKKLITLALSNGNISENERAIILKKGRDLGLDAAEVEMQIEGGLEEIDASKKNKVDEISNDQQKPRNCPGCGATVDASALNCKSCDYEY